jgi:acyl-CoA synthetase (AMP-forming)/AMP-acid ligase II
MHSNALSTVPLAVAAPAALATFAYLNAKASLFYDWNILGSGIGAQIRCAIKEKRDKLNLFYVLEEHAKGKLANKVFIVFEGRKWTFKETYEAALKYGTWFKTKYGVKSKEVVAMDFMNGEKFLFVWFGLWSIGAKPAFINYNLTGKALAHCIGVSTTRLILVDPEVQGNITQEVRDDLPNVKFEIFTPDLEAEVIATNAVRVEDSELSETLAQNMAILIYTSGTTGLPKPAIVSWRKVVLSSYLFPNWMGFTKDDNFYTVSLLP